MGTRLTSILKRIPLPVVYIAIVLGVAASYLSVRKVMIMQEGSFIAILSNVTLNLVLLYGIWGVLIDKFMKNKPKWLSWSVFIAGLFALTLFFKYVGGFETIVFG